MKIKVQPRRLRTIVFTIARSSWLIGIFLLASPSLLYAEPSINVVSRENLSSEHRNELAIKLRRITGWPDLEFDREGALRLGTRELSGGSKSARALLRSVVYGANVVVLEDASKRDDVVFCRVVPGRWKDESAGKSPVYVVLIDFVDFEQVMGDQRALNAFDVGWGLLHELDHIESDSADSTSIGEPGECEEHINQMRRECNLPQRAVYFFTPFPLSPDDPFRTRFVRLAFEQEDAGTDKKKRYWLIWDAKLVGGLNEQKQIALLR